MIAATNGELTGMTPERLAEIRHRLKFAASQAKHLEERLERLEAENEAMRAVVDADASVGYVKPSKPSTR